MITNTVTKIHAARDVIGDNYIHGNGPSIEAIRFEKTRGPKESRLFFRIPGAVSSGAPSSSSLFPSGQAAPGTRPESIMFFSNGLELMRGNGSHVNSNDSDVEKEGSVESRVIGTTRLNAAKLYA